MSEKIILSFSFSEKIKGKLQALADKNTRTLSDYIKKILDKEVKQLIIKREKNNMTVVRFTLPYAVEKADMLKAEAKHRRRTVSNYLQTLFANHVKQNFPKKSKKSKKRTKRQRK